MLRNIGRLLGHGHVHRLPSMRPQQDAAVHQAGDGTQDRQAQASMRPQQDAAVHPSPAAHPAQDEAASMRPQQDAAVHDEARILAALEGMLQ